MLSHIFTEEVEWYIVKVKTYPGHEGSQCVHACKKTITSRVSKNPIIIYCTW